MGKVLLEKLLYSCSDLKQVVILVRPKRGKSEAERVAGLEKIPVSYSEDLKVVLFNQLSACSYVDVRKNSERKS